MANKNKLKLLVSSNCQTEGIAEALKVMLPNYEVAQLQILPSYQDFSYLEETINDGIDVLITSNQNCFNKDFTGKYPNLKIIRIPQIIFSAFHPDLVYATDSPDDGNANFIKCLDSNYHSAICLWGWKNNLTVEETIKLYKYDVFFKLGYFNSWSSSFSELKQKFSLAKLDFTTFWSSIKNTGLFMHSIDHPNIYVLSELSKQIAVSLGAEESLINEPTHRVLSDALTATRWPVYPEIGEHYGLVGMYKWKIRRSIYVSLSDYISNAYNSYDELSLPKEQISFYQISLLSDGYLEFDKILRSMREI